MKNAEKSGRSASSTPRGGTLRALIERGHVQPGDHLSLVRPPGVPSFCAAVRADGRIETNDGVIIAEPRPADLVYHGAPGSGWLCYLHEPSGRTLGDLLSDPSPSAESSPISADGRVRLGADRPRHVRRRPPRG